jgi:hypothetical protein
VTENALPPSDSSAAPLPAGSPILLTPAGTRGRSTVTSPDVGRSVHVFTPAILLPVQVTPPVADRWLRRLCRAILEDALACLEGKGSLSNKESDGEVGRRRHEAWRWVESEAEYCLSFVTVCAVLNLDAQAVRRQVRQRTLKDKPDRHTDVWAEVEATTAAAHETVARAHAAFDRARQLLHELDDSRQLHRAITERQAEQQPRSHSEQPPSPIAQAPDSPPETMPSAEPRTKNEAGEV